MCGRRICRHILLRRCRLWPLTWMAAAGNQPAPESAIIRISGSSRLTFSADSKPFHRPDRQIRGKNQLRYAAWKDPYQYAAWKDPYLLLMSPKLMSNPMQVAQMDSTTHPSVLSIAFASRNKMLYYTAEGATRGN
jgi:hypothetical protein